MLHCTDDVTFQLEQWCKQQDAVEFTQDAPFSPSCANRYLAGQFASASFSH